MLQKKEGEEERGSGAWKRKDFFEVEMRFPFPFCVEVEQNVFAYNEPGNRLPFPPLALSLFHKGEQKSEEIFGTYVISHYSHYRSNTDVLHIIQLS